MIYRFYGINKSESFAILRQVLPLDHDPVTSMKGQLQKVPPRVWRHPFTISTRTFRRVPAKPRDTSSLGTYTVVTSVCRFSRVITFKYAEKYEWTVP